METEYLRAFCEVARWKSFRRAAESLQVTQSCVSRRLQSLEQELGVRLLERGPHAVNLTGEGKAFLPFAQRALDVIREGSAAVDRRSEERSLAIGATPTLSFGLLPRAATRFIQRFSQLRLRIFTAPPPELFESLLDRTLEIAVSTARIDDPRIHQEELPGEPILCVASPGLAASLARGGEGGRIPWIRSLNMADGVPPWNRIQEMIERDGRFRLVAEAEFLQVAEPLARAGVGVAFLPRSVAVQSLDAGGLVEVPLPFSLPPRPIYLSTLEEAPARPIHAEFIALLREEARAKG